MKVLILINKVGLGDCIIHLNYIHEISKKYEKPVSILAKENTRAKDLFQDDPHIKEVITLDRLEDETGSHDGLNGFIKLIKDIKEKNIIFEAGGLSDDFLLSDSYDIVINSTSVSTQVGKSIGLPKALFSGTKLAYDLFYSAEKTVFMQEAFENGAEIVSDGWGMLVEQGAESFRLWTNLIPDTSRLLEKPID